MSVLDLLARRRLVVVTGKGGTGKSTLAAALGRLLAGAGRKTLVVEVDPRESLHQALGVEPSGGEVVQAGEGLWIQNVQAQAVIEGLVREKVPVPFFARKITESPAFRHFVAGAPGFKETAVLGHAYRATRGHRTPRVEVVVLDAPASGHGASLLAAPALLALAAEGGQLGEVAAELAAFLADPAQCAIFLGTLAEEMPVQETLELLETLDSAGGPRVAMVCVNALFPPLPADLLEAVRQDLWGERRRLQERERARLRDRWEGPLAELPLLPLDRGPALTRDLATRLGEARW
ncbi:MAG: AAA family ATPase [Acidobacteria bacterium]|nr:AAA family ATPase [Acidobacteriota bacterium]